MTAPFVGTNDLEDAIGRTLEAGTETDLAVIALDSACEIVRGYLDNQVNLLEETIVLDGNGRARLVLPRPPVRSIVLVLEEDVPLVETDDYVLEAAGILRRVDALWPRGYGNLEVSYEHGWDIEEPDDPEYVPEDFERVPSDLRSVALDLARRKFLGGGSSSVEGAVTEESIGGGDYRYRVSEGALATATATTLLLEETRILDRYRAPVNL